MVLIYTYIQQYKNFIDQEFKFHQSYQVHFSQKMLSVTYLGQDPVQEALFSEYRVDGLQLLVGKTGSGKTNLLQMLGELEEYRRGQQMELPVFDRNSWAPHTQEGAYFFLYADAPGSYYIECKDMRLPQFEPVWSEHLKREEDSRRRLQRELSRLKKDIRSLRLQIKEKSGRKGTKKLKERLKQKTETAARLSLLLQQDREPNLFWSAVFSLDRKGALTLNGEQREPDTWFLNCYDQNSFSIRPYPDLGRRGYRLGKWLPRMALPYQQAPLVGKCRYIMDYVQSMEPGDLKHRVSFHVSNENFEYAVNSPVEKAWEKAFRRWARQPRTVGQKTRSNRDIFIHDLWVDYCLYLYKEARQVELFPEETLSEKERLFREATDYMLNKETFPYVEAAHFPRPDGENLPLLCQKLASYLDYHGEDRAHGLLWQIWDDIKDITELLARYEGQYFTPTTFEIPVKIMTDSRHEEITHDLFERMEQYRPDSSDLFDRDLLLCHFTHLSAGELQYARVFGLLSDYLNAPVQSEADPKHYIILLDEPDASLHPELCRQFLHRLLNVCRDSKRGRTCQLLISTHSPFFLSDVAQSNILRLGIDKQTGYGFTAADTQTRYLGANIHDIMADGFFLESTIGEHARSKLLALQRELKEVLHTGHPISVDSSWFVTRRLMVEQIGDDIIRGLFELLLKQVEDMQEVN